MIDTIIFDLGNVLISWKPDEYLEKNIPDINLRNKLLNHVFRGPEWLKLDNGDITIDDAIDAIAVKASLKKEQIRAAFDMRKKILFPLTRNTKLLPSLKKRGFRLYFLSNFPDDLFDEIHAAYDFFRFFDGGEISARLNASKPDVKIFQIFLNNHSLNPENCLFIDDSHYNATSAEFLGMKVIHLENPEILQQNLENVLNIKIS